MGIIDFRHTEYLLDLSCRGLEPGWISPELAGNPHSTALRSKLNGVITLIDLTLFHALLEKEALSQTCTTQINNPMLRTIIVATVIKMLSSTGPISYLSTIEATTAANTPHKGMGEAPVLARK